MIEILDFFNEKEIKCLKVIGGTSDMEYNYLLKQLSIKNNEKSCIIFKGHIPFPCNNELVSMLKQKIKNIDLNHIENSSLNLTGSSSLDAKLKKAFTEILSPKLCQPKYKSQSIKENFFLKQVVLVYEYVNSVAWNNDFPPLCVYYGDLNEKDADFLKMLHIIGFKILYLNSETDTNFLNGEKLDYPHLKKMEFDDRVKSAPAELNEESPSVVKTWAKEARKKLDEEFYGEYVFRPSQFRTGTTKAIFLDAEIEDIESYWDNQSRLRPEFKTEGKTVFVPCFSTQINGVYKDIGKYKEFVLKTLSAKNTVFKTDVPLVQNCIPKQDIFSLAYVIKNNCLDFEKVKSHKIYGLKNCSEHTQNFILGKLNEFLNVYKDNVQIKDFLVLLSTVITLPGDYINIIQNFDFPFDVPKVVWYISSHLELEPLNGLFINFLNLIGIDLLIYSTAGSACVKNCMSFGFLNTVELENYNCITFADLKKIKTNKGFLEKIKNLFS